MQFPFTLKHNCEFDVVGFGTNAVDFLIRVPHYPEFNSKVELLDYVQMPGGEIATTTVGLSRLGLRSSYVGRFGDDPAGDLGLSSLRNEGVDLRFAERIGDTPTQIAFIVIDERNGERTVIWKRDAKLHYNEDDAPLPAIESAKVLHVSPHDTGACTRLAKAARVNGTIVSVDVDKRFEGIEQLLENVDIMITSADFLRTLFGIEGGREALIKMQERFGSGIVGVTLGENGSLLLCNGQFIETRGYDVPGGCKDTTGAGDSFRVGLLYGLIEGYSIEESARMANAVAALKCRAVGARTSLPDRDELATFLKNS
ncbi:MAG TPA: carbohydrate kinase family protein [Pyrinomonadaceae bacterium]|nr:carbohydrate kinase family protein [Pyrinomonadaceae bacterium]